MNDSHFAKVAHAEFQSYVILAANLKRAKKGSIAPSVTLSVSLCFTNSKLKT